MTDSLGGAFFENGFSPKGAQKNSQNGVYGGGRVYGLFIHIYIYIYIFFFPIIYLFPILRKNPIYVAH